MTNISKQVLLICAFAGASLGPAGADPFNMPPNGGLALAGEEADLHLFDRQALAEGKLQRLDLTESGE